MGGKPKTHVFRHTCFLRKGELKQKWKKRKSGLEDFGSVFASKIYSQVLREGVQKGRSWLSFEIVPRMIKCYLLYKGGTLE